jgi:methionyl-tRNA formyltransferase
MGEARRTAVFLGSKALGLNVFACLADAHPGLEWTIIHADDAADPRNRLEDFRALAASRGVAFHVVRAQPEARARIAELSPEIGFVCGWYWLFSAADIDAFPQGLWGIHNSLLPKFRGGAPLVWAILAGEKEVGSTVFRISPGMDDGDVLMQVRIALAPHEDIADALRRIEQGLLELLGDHWSALLEGCATLAPQDESQATWCGQRSDEDGGIDWSKPAPALHDFIRAQAPPYPGAWSWLGGVRLRITKARPFDGVYFGTPGQVLRRTGDSVLVACSANTALELLALSVDGVVAPQSPSAVIRSVKDRLSLSPRPAT